jgi:phenylalanyl-tRNA synthetase alpha chain
MLAQPPPVYVVVPGRTYRQDTPDATHLPAFHQIEGLAIDTDLSFADLRGTLAELARNLLGPETSIRMRPHHFRFTEPSCEVDAWHDGRWIELLGAGMVHPSVLAHVGYDSEAVQGFAFGIGVERIAMLRHGITDIRLFVESDLRFLSAF